jgi:hypothetical protein
MFLKETARFKDGKEHRYWSLVENRRVDGGRKVVQRHVLYLGEINSSQQAAWRKTIEVFETGSGATEVRDRGELDGSKMGAYIWEWFPRKGDTCGAA